MREHPGKRILTEEHKKKIGDALKGRKLSKERIQKSVNGRKGFKHSEETKKKMSELRKGKLWCPITNLDWTGKTHSSKSKDRMRHSQLKYSKDKSLRFQGENNPSKRPEVREKISKLGLNRVISIETKMKMSQSRIGDKNPNWRGGIKFNPYGSNWTETLRKAIRQRDNYQCRCCGKRQQRPKLDVHHINYDRTNNDPLNLVALCKSCHARTNFSRKLWITFFRSNAQMRIIK